MNTCGKCNKDNRAEAKYCRFCGGTLAQAFSQKELIGKLGIQPQLDELDKKLQVAKTFAQSGTKIGLDCLILGDSGTGKRFLAHLVADKMAAAGVAKQPPKEVDAADWADFFNDFDKNMAALKDGILLITNAQKLLPTSKSSEVNQLDKLFTRMRITEGAPVVLLCGTLNDMTGFLENNKDVHRLFELEFRLEAFKMADLSALTQMLLKDKYHAPISAGVEELLEAHFAWCMRQKEVGYTNGHLAEKTAEDLSVKAAYRGSKTVEERDIDMAECFFPKSEEQILADLDNYIGLQSVKDEIRAIVSNVKMRKEKGLKEKLLKDHYLFTGNPGTGKTTFARKFGEVLNAIGALPTGQFVEISGKDFIGQFVGDTEANVKNYVNKAMGGVLFIDESYALMGSNGGKGGFGLDAVNTLLNLLENRKGEFVCIMAGYTKEMGEFVRMNPGIPSRCNVTIEFPDYSARELEQLFRMMLARNDEDTVFSLDARAEEMLPKVFDRMYLKRSDTFGNAREVRNLFDLAIKRHRMRKAADDVLTYADLVGEAETKEISVEDVMKELDGFVGMKSVKEAIRRIAQEIAVQKQLIEMGEASEGLTKFNFILTGNPGTGKSTVARTFGKIFKALGVTSTDRVVEKVPSDIIGMYINESDKNMNAAINEAMGGILFLDEAYDIEPMDEAGRSTSSEGKKAVQMLMTRMENEAGKFVVVCAGYPKEMATFMNSNPGLKRRFSHTIHIDDYTAEEMLRIFENAAKAKKYNFTLADDAVRMKALKMFQNMVAMKDEKFGNAGEAIKKVAETKTNINNRISKLPFDQWTPEALHSAFLEDIPFEEPEKVSVDDCLAELNDLIGLDGVKASLTKLAHTINNEIESAKAENRRPEIPLGHYLFLGNPGTGKTTVARLMGKILYSMGALPTPTVVEVGKADLVGRYVGDTEAITSHVIDTAMGGILFIDEAYQLASDQFGRSALETLVARLENDRGKFVCIAAGYTYEMQAFLAENSGFESRFPERNRITFEDYSPAELSQIFMIYARKGGYTLDAMAENAVRGKLTMIYNNRGRTFGNGRDARNLFDEVKSNLAARLAEDEGPHTAEERKTIMMEDVI
ncbi:MAG: AAA family ATPase [Bacteroidales bacterium]|nr:AAA family ATPase [Bacteroidales bacterium]